MRECLGEVFAFQGIKFSHEAGAEEATMEMCISRIVAKIEATLIEAQHSPEALVEVPAPLGGCSFHCWIGRSSFPRHDRAQQGGDSGGLDGPISGSSVLSFSVGSSDSASVVRSHIVASSEEMLAVSMESAASRPLPSVPGPISTNDPSFKITPPQSVNKDRCLLLFLLM